MTSKPNQSKAAILSTVAVATVVMLATANPTQALCTQSKYVVDYEKPASRSWIAMAAIATIVLTLAIDLATRNSIEN